MADNDAANLERWLGWVRERASKGRWYPKGERAARDIAGRMGEEELAHTRERLEELRTLCMERMGEDGRRAASERVNANIRKIGRMMETGDHAGAQKLILSTRIRAEEHLLPDRFEKELEGLYRENTRAAFANPLALSLMDAARSAYLVNWKLDRERREELERAIGALMDDDGFTPVSELVGMARQLGDGLEWSYWLEDGAE